MHPEMEQDLLLSSSPHDEVVTAEDYEQIQERRWKDVYNLSAAMFHQKHYVKYSFNKFSYQEIT